MSIRWICPRDGECLTDVAVHYVWSAEPDAKQYTVEYAYDPDFTSPVAEIADPLPNDCRCGALIPADENLPRAGEVYARVRADEGEWSETLHFSVNEDHPHAALKYVIDPAHPYLLITDYSQHEWRAPWDLLPDRIKPYVAIASQGMCIAESDNAGLRDYLMEMDGIGINWSLTAYGPHEADGGNYSCCPLCDVEYLLKRQKNLKSLMMVEQYLGRHPDSYHHAVYMRRLIVLCGKYGVHFVYPDGNRNNIEMPPFFNSGTAELMREYAPYCSVLFKQNHSHAAYTVYGAIMGAWEAGVCGNIGVQGENWYWNDAGYRDETGRGFGYLQGIEQQMPYSMGTQMLLTGLSMGGCVYSLEGQGWLIECEDGRKARWSRQGRAVITLFSSIVDHAMIPEKPLVMEKLHAMLKCDLSCIDQGDAWTGGVWRKAFDPIYRDPEGYALFMKCSRYFVLPIANRFTKNDLPTFSAQDITESDQLPRLLDPLYPVWAGGDCYMTQAGDTTVVMNSQENQSCAQDYDITIGRGPVKRISGALDLWQHFVLRATDDGAVLMVDGPEMSRIDIRMDTDARMTATADGNEISAEYTDGGMILSVVPNGTPVIVQIAREGAPDRLMPRLPVDDHPDYNWLSNLPFASVRTSCGALPAKNACVNARYGRMPLYVNGMIYVHGIGMTDGTEITYDLGGRYAGLTMHYGFDMDAWMPRILDRDRIVWDRYPRQIDLLLRVYADGNLIHTSSHMRSTYVMENARLDVSGVRELKITLYGEVRTSSPDDIVCFDIVNPRLLSEAEFAALPEKEETGWITNGVFRDSAVSFKPQVQITVDNQGKLQTEFLSE